MRRKTLQLLAFTGAIAIGASAGHTVFAQTETVNVTFITTSAIASTDVSDMDFGEWVVQIGATDDAANDVTLTLTNDGSVAVNEGGVTDSVVLEVTPTASEGVVSVQTPAASNLTITRSGTVAMSDGNITLSTVTYRTASEGPIDLSADNDTGAVTVLGAATDEDVTFGGILTFAATPTDDTHTGSFDVTFSY